MTTTLTTTKTALVDAVAALDEALTSADGDLDLFVTYWPGQGFHAAMYDDSHGEEPAAATVGPTLAEALAALAQAVTL